MPLVNFTKLSPSYVKNTHGWVLDRDDKIVALLPNDYTPPPKGTAPIVKQLQKGLAEGKGRSENVLFHQIKKFFGFFTMAPPRPSK